MKRSVKYLALLTIFVVGASGKYVNGPWLINRIHHLIPARTPSKALSPVIFGSLLNNLRKSRDDFKVQVHYFLFKFLSQFPEMAEVKLTHDLTNQVPFIISAIKQRVIGSTYG